MYLKNISDDVKELMEKFNELDKLNKMKFNH